MSTRRRTCVGCRRPLVPDIADSGGSIRIAAAKDGSLGIGSAAPGRGAWVCSAECFEAAARRGALARALRRGLASTDIEALRATLFEK